MKFTVLCTPEAEQDLAAASLASTDRNAMTTAASEIDRRLAIDPESAGQSHFDTMRTLVRPPLGVDFEVVTLDCIV